MAKIWQGMVDFIQVNEINPLYFLEVFHLPTCSMLTVKFDVFLFFLFSSSPLLRPCSSMCFVRHSIALLLSSLLPSSSYYFYLREVRLSMWTRIPTQTPLNRPKRPCSKARLTGPPRLPSQVDTIQFNIQMKSTQIPTNSNYCFENASYLPDFF